MFDVLSFSIGLSIGTLIAVLIFASIEKRRHQGNAIRRQQAEVDADNKRTDAENQRWAHAIDML